MKLKKLAAKIPLLALITMCLTSTKAFAEYEECWYPHSPLIGQAILSHKGTEVIITDVNKKHYRLKEALKKSEYDYNQRLSDSIIRIRKIIPDVSKITFEGITYEIIPESRELKITGTPDCSPILRKSVLNVLSVMPAIDTAFEEKTVWSPQKGYHREYCNGHARSGEKDAIGKVTFEGNIRFIPSYFFQECYIPDPESTSDGLYNPKNSIQPKIIDLSKSNVEKVGFKAFNLFGLQKVILPEHTVCIESSSYETVVGCEEDNTQIENSEYAKYQEPPKPSLYDDPYDNSCCTLI